MRLLSQGHYDHPRYRDVSLGRFLSPDLVGGKPEDPQTWNRYAYARDNPLKFVDPDGREFGYPGQQTELNRVLAAQALARGSEICIECNAGHEAIPLESLGQPLSPEGALGTASLLASFGVSGLFRAGGGALARSAGGAGPVRLGQIGEEIAGVAGAKVRIPSLTGTAQFRVPDALTQSTLIEVKNAARVGLTSQIRDFVRFSEATNRNFVLVVRSGARISRPLQRLIDEGRIILRRLPDQELRYAIR